jgi:hypothetical protein
VAVAEDPLGVLVETPVGELDLEQEEDLVPRLALVREDVLDGAEEPERLDGNTELLLELADDCDGCRFAELDPAADEAVEPFVLDAVVAVDQEQVVAAADDAERDGSYGPARRSLRPVAR